MAGATLFTGGNLSPGEREDRWQPWVLAAFGLIGLLVRLSAGLHGPEGVWTLTGTPFAGWASLSSLSAACCGSGRSSCSAVGSAGWSPSSQGIRWSRMASTGVIRHPSYLGLLVNALGWALAFRSGVGLLLTAAAIPPLLARIRAEERLLHAQLGMTMTRIALARRGSSPASIKANGCRSAASARRKPARSAGRHHRSPP